MSIKRSCTCSYAIGNMEWNRFVPSKPSRLTAASQTSLLYNTKRWLTVWQKQTFAASLIIWHRLFSPLFVDCYVLAHSLAFWPAHYPFHGPLRRLASWLTSLLAANLLIIKFGFNATFTVCSLRRPGYALHMGSISKKALLYDTAVVIIMLFE